MGAGVAVVALVSVLWWWTAVGGGLKKADRELKMEEQGRREDGKISKTAASRLRGFAVNKLRPGESGSQPPVAVAGPDRQPEVRYRAPVRAPGLRAVAKVQREGKDYRLTPNQVGTFQRIYVQPGETVPIAISYPNGQPGDPVLIEAEDSGKLLAQAGIGGGSVGMTGRLNDQRTVEFAFEVSQNRGIHRVLLRKGNDVKVLDFWAGESLPLAGISQ
jgi:hypothetical protein